MQFVGGEHNVDFGVLVRVVCAQRGYAGTGTGGDDGTARSVRALPSGMVDETAILGRSAERERGRYILSLYVVQTTTLCIILPV